MMSHLTRIYTALFANLSVFTPSAQRVNIRSKSFNLTDYIRKIKGLKLTINV